MKVWWTVIRMANADPSKDSVVIVRKGKMHDKGMKRLAKKFALKHKTVKLNTDIAWRHVFQAKRPRF
jgi:hypothetical protein